MLTWLRDTLDTVRLRARYRRLVQEQLLALAEDQRPRPVSDEAGGWTLAGSGKAELDALNRDELRTRARRLIRTNPYARNLVRLLEVYVVGPGLKVTPAPIPNATISPDVLQVADRLWRSFLQLNRAHFSFREHARRAWRDGECFLRLFRQVEWPPTVRFVDPELIGSPNGAPDDDGLVSAPDDVETVLAYRRLDPSSGAEVEQIPAAELIHTRLGVDTNELRGVTLLAPVLDALCCFEKWLDTELQARKLQASIVLWRKVQGSPSQAAALADAAADSDGGSRRERYRPGTILTTSHGTDLQFLQPHTNFGDAVPLGRLVLLSIAAGAGVPEFMLSSDASNANFASTMVAEGPAVKLFESEQQFFAAEFDRLWRWIMSEAIAQGFLPADFLDQVEPGWTFPQLVNRDRSKERLADVRLVEAGVLSRAEVARRDNVDPQTMQAELRDETGAPPSALHQM